MNKKHYHCKSFTEWVLWFCVFGASLAFSQTPLDISTRLDQLTPGEMLLYQDTAGDLKCPTCNGLSVLQSDAPFSQQIKYAVIDQVQKGQSKEKILSYFSERYGPWILRQPPKEGIHLLAWLLPVILLIFGSLLLWRLYWFRDKIKFIPTKELQSDAMILEQMKLEIQKLNKQSF